MDELLNDFLTETSEHLEAASSQLVEFETDPSNSTIVASIFRLVHTIKGTCGFLGLGRLEAIAHAAEAVISRLRDGTPATPEIVTLVLAAVDRIKLILGEIEANAAEPPGDDADLIGQLESELDVLAPDSDDADFHSSGVVQAGPSSVPERHPAGSSGRSDPKRSAST